jgi:hypothetical protein
VLHSHFAHSSSATLNTAQEQSALLGRIQSISCDAGDLPWHLTEERHWRETEITFYLSNFLLGIGHVFF